MKQLEENQVEKMKEEYFLKRIKLGWTAEQVAMHAKIFLRENYHYKLTNKKGK